MVVGKLEPLANQFAVISCSLPTRGNMENLSGSFPTVVVPFSPLALAVIAERRSTKSRRQFDPNPLIFLNWPIATLSTTPFRSTNSSAIEPLRIVGKRLVISPHKGTLKDPNDTFHVCGITETPRKEGPSFAIEGKPD